jgi:16S rRNA (cytidine1402-2'-O)-methyltransferase|tara:strand:- start:3416 stop:4258 length:843 start_codon:yes stop_codon:yes gene_type:complete
MENGKLFVVATPIGNLDDTSKRSLKTLNDVDLIAAEDTRKTRHLLSHFNIKARMISLHEHNEEEAAKKLIKEIKNGNSVALVSDAGTPAINDPGYRLILQAHKQNITVVPLPGPCSIISALSVSGLPSDRFCFEGYLPAKSESRKSKLKELEKDERTLIFLISVHKISQSLEDILLIFGGDRIAFIAREMTKIYEQCTRTNLGELLKMIEVGEIPKKGEFVLIVEGCKENNDDSLVLARDLMGELINNNLSSQAVDIVTKVTKIKRNIIYKMMLELKKEQ